MQHRIPSSRFLPLIADGPAGSYAMDVSYELCSGRGDLWGGVGLAASINALSDMADGLPVVMVSAQFLSNKTQANRLFLTCDVISKSRTVAQGFVQGALDDVAFIRVAACLGKRNGSERVDLPKPLEIPRYDQCPDVDLGTPRTAMHTHTEVRLAGGMFGVTGQGLPNESGTLSLWMRMPGVENDAGSLIILADYMLSGIGSALGQVAFGISLDNTIRIARVVPTDWVQCDISMEHVGDGFGYGTAHLYSEDGTLMATASQSVIVRMPK